MNNLSQKQPIDRVRHSLSHLLAMAVIKKYPKVKLGIGPVIENGFYYDFGNAKITSDDLLEFEKTIKNLIKNNLSFKKSVITLPQAKKIFKNQPYKLELINDIKKSKKPITIYKSGDFIDLCAGPHIKSTAEINPEAFKLIKTAGAYWKGSEKNPMLTRIYGVAFSSKEELDNYLKSQEEIEKRDHRILGEKLGIFMIDEHIGKGLPVYLPNGYFVRRQLENYIYDLERQDGYLHVLTPNIVKEELYKTSGHLAHYKDDMYAPIEIEGEKYYLKPMNCPEHHFIYKKLVQSYRDLPLKIAEFGTVYRFERSGVLSGLIRTRGFTQNDAHIYVTPAQLEKEINGVLDLQKKVYDDFNITDYWFRLSLPDFKNKKKFGDIKNKKGWQEASNILKKILQKRNLKFVEAVGEASFYGPKIDVQIKNVYSKEDTIATVQVDFYSASRFGLSYADEDSKIKQPIIIHRAIFGSFERFMAFLLEKTAGKLPLWLSPIQAVIINIGLNEEKYAQKIFQELKNANIRTELWNKDSVSKRIREAEIKKIPYVLVVGNKEALNGTASLRHYKLGQEGEIKIEDLIRKINQEIIKKQ